MREEGELPEGWRAARLDEVVQPSTEKVDPRSVPAARYIGLEHVESGTNRILGEGRGADVGSTKAVFRRGNVLYGKLRPYLNKVCRPDFDGICSTDFIVFSPSSETDAEFLKHILSIQEFVDFATDRSAGVQLPRVSFEKLSSFELSLPPIPEQKRIAERIGKLLDLVRGARGRLASVPIFLKRFRQAILSAACDGRLTANCGLQRPPSVSKGTPCAASAETATNGWVSVDRALPTTWNWVKFERLLGSLRMGTTAPPRNEATPFPVLRSSSVRPRAINLEDVKYLRSSESASPDNFIEEGDLLFTRLSGSLEYVANCAVVRDLKGMRLQYPDRLFRGRLQDPDLGPYIELCFGSPILRRGLEIRSKSSAGHQRISMSALTEFWIPLPPISEMHEIVRRVEVLFALADTIEKRVAAASAHADKLTQAILAKAFRGELVPTEAELNRRREASTVTPPPAVRPTAARPAPRRSR